MVHFADDVARHFFVQNVVFLAREYRIDAFRFDMTRPIHNQGDGNIRQRGSGGGWDFLDVGVAGRYQELANSSWPAFNLGNYPERTRGGERAFDITDVPVPAYGAVVLVRWD